MNNVIKYNIINEDSLVFSINRIYQFMISIKIDEMQACLIATKLSEISRVLYPSHRFELMINLYNELDQKKHLQFELFTPEERNFSQIHAGPYVNLDWQKDKVIISSRYLDNLNENLISQNLDELIKKSREELTIEIEQKNTELNAMLEQLKTSSSLIQTEKMRALGIMTAGVAHELNNPMMGILNFVQYCIKKIPPDNKCNSVLIDAEKEVKRCIDIVRNLLTFSRMEKEGDEIAIPTNVDELITRVISVLTYKIRKEHANIIKIVPDELPLIKLKPHKFQQVLLNFIGNAIDAVTEREIRNVTIEALIVDDNFILDIRDTGCGIPDRLKNKILEPFFTTKTTDKGTGLGLPVSKSIIEDHGGTLVIESAEGLGSSFKSIIPLNIE